MSNLTIKGRITKILEVESGTSKAGKDWKKQNFVIDTGDQFNPEVCFQMFGEEKCENLTKYNKVGDEVEVSFNVSSREFNGKYYHNLDAWKVMKATVDEGYKNQPNPTSEPAEDDLPF